jgi:hypothetical protein
MFASFARTTAKVAIRSSSAFAHLVTMPKRFAAQHVDQYVPWCICLLVVFDHLQSI